MPSLQSYRSQEGRVSIHNRELCTCPSRSLGTGTEWGATWEGLIEDSNQRIGSRRRIGRGRYRSREPSNHVEAVATALGGSVGTTVLLDGGMDCSARGRFKGHVPPVKQPNEEGWTGWYTPMTSVQTPAWCLTFAQPPAQQILVDRVQSIPNGQCAHAAKNLPSMRLPTRSATVPSIEITTTLHELDGLVHLDGIEPTKQIKTAQCTVRKSRVDLAPLVSCEGSVRLLQTLYVRNHPGHIQQVQPVQQHQDLNGTERVQHVGIMAHIPCEPPAFSLALHQPFEHSLQFHVLQLPYQMHGCESPVHATDTDVFCDKALQRFFLLARGSFTHVHCFFSLQPQRSLCAVFERRKPPLRERRQPRFAGEASSPGPSLDLRVPASIPGRAGSLAPCLPEHESELGARIRSALLSEFRGVCRRVRFAAPFSRSSARFAGMFRGSDPLIGTLFRFDPTSFPSVPEGTRPWPPPAVPFRSRT
eukprot:scaffold64_cov338-Pavlova_lutheri.AAC.7